LPATPSLAEYGEGFGLGAADLRWFWDKYLAPGDERHPHASPMRTPDLRGLPPALLITAECDPLRDDGEQFAARLRESGVPTTVSRYEGGSTGSSPSLGWWTRRTRHRRRRALG
jgi:acetyl esterase